VNYQLVNVDVVRTQEVETDAAAGFGFLSYYVYAEIIMMTDAVAVVAETVPAFSAVTEVIAANGLSFS